MPEDSEPGPDWRRRTGVTVHLQAPSGAHWQRRLTEGEDFWTVVGWLHYGLNEPCDLTWWVEPRS